MSARTSLRLALTVGVIAGLAATLALVALASSAGPRASTAMVSLFDKSAKAADQGAFSPSVSQDGRYVAFESQSFLARTPTGGSLQVYVRDRKTGRTVLVSRATGAHGAVANGPSDAPAISADGRFVAFESSAHNLVPGFVPVDRSACDTGDGEQLGDIYVRDLVAHTTVLISHANGSATTPGDFYSQDPYISADGKVVVFSSAATNIATDGGTAPGGGCADVHNPAQQLYVSKRATNALAMVRPDGGGVPDGAVDAYAVSGNGAFVAYSTAATNMLVSGPQPQGNAYVQDLLSGTNELVSRATGAGGAVADTGAGGVAVNGDGSKVVFASEATNLGFSNPNGVQEIYLRDRTTQTTSLVSKTTSGDAGDGDSGPAVISYNGRFVAFETAAPNLGGAKKGTSEITQIGLRDLKAGTTTLLSRGTGASSPKANKYTEDVAISRDGSTVGYESPATNLVKGKNFSASQVLVRGHLYAPAVKSGAKISGQVQVHQKVACVAKFAAPAQVTFQWLSNGKPIPKATKQTFTIPAQLANHKLACSAAATSGDGTAVSTSRPQPVRPA